MIAVLASAWDSEAQSVVAAWSRHDAALLSARDLTTAGWEFHSADPAAGVAVLDGRRVPVAKLQAVLTRRPAVLAEELTSLTTSDRSYAAAEINAFLVAWLTSLRCKVVNRPTATSLCGPAWDAIHWRSAAAAAGVDWTGENDHTAMERVVVCGSHCFFTTTAKQRAVARVLARAAGVDLLSVSFRGDRPCSACVSPPLDDPEVREFLVSHLLGAA